MFVIKRKQLLCTQKWPGTYRQPTNMTCLSDIFDNSRQNPLLFSSFFCNTAEVISNTNQSTIGTIVILHNPFHHICYSQARITHKTECGRRASNFFYCLMIIFLFSEKVSIPIHSPKQKSICVVWFGDMRELLSNQSYAVWWCGGGHTCNGS